MAKIIVGMSGGVDSAVAAYILKMAGHDVSGVTLRVWMNIFGEDSRCCEIDDARKASHMIGIPYYVENCVEEFNEKIIKKFINDYISGLTPNPCVECNRCIKWDKMIETADMMQADYVATGHYAHVIKLDNGRYTVKTADHAEKDQTYMLYRLTQDQLKRTIMPLGALSKDEVREIAKKADLFVANKPDSQEICFVTDGNYAEYIEYNSETEVPGEGNFVDEDGNILGRHKGIIHYTIGQRKGLGIALGHPVFVKEINAEKNEVVLSLEDALFTNEVICGRLNFLSIPGIESGEEIRANAKIRYHHKPQAATLSMIGEDKLKIVFDEPVRAATPGQSSVFYDENGCVIGGGVIEKA
ncbi:tRNA 2-thiouridine(34) synthase MnmA [Eubacterium ruminantium]|uniref:tRNA 2-thiouridine(34) synthase MnmA n=1 Tax=Eubacterium ruminantium TaxID=42322 RepID=UPI001567C9B9|nr:tRNA 2-thiouridine(34) synthase MnmA [Eubacterium ruminantium]